MKVTVTNDCKGYKSHKRNLAIRNLAMPNAMSREEELKYQRFKDEIKKISEKNRKKTKDYSNLNEGEKNGLESLREKIKTKEVICYQTEKNG